MGIFGGLFAPESKKSRKRRLLTNNLSKGNAAMRQAMLQDMLRGYEVERAPIGQDYIRRKRDLWSGRVTKTEHVEVKSGNAKLSKLQQKTRRKKSNYVVKRVNPLIW